MGTNDENALGAKHSQASLNGLETKMVANRKERERRLKEAEEERVAITKVAPRLANLRKLTNFARSW